MIIVPCRHDTALDRFDLYGLLAAGVRGAPSALRPLVPSRQVLASLRRRDGFATLPTPQKASISGSSPCPQGAEMG